MPTTRINCPNCRQPIMSEVMQLFDVGENPNAKQILLSGAVNFIQCPNCGYQGQFPTPIVYHDPEKQLLLTFIPPEVNLPRPEQERIIGSLIQQVVNTLPQEKKKAYLFQPQQSLTMQGLVERILEADGITKEMIDAQQKRLHLIQQLLITSDESFGEVVEQEQENIDEDFFAILNRLVEASVASGDRNTAQSLVDLQRKLLPLTEYGQKIQAQTEEIEAAMKSLQDLGSEFTREKLLQLIIDAPSNTRLEALISLARPALDYSFFELLTARIESSKGEEKTKLNRLRGKILEITQEIDQQIEHRKDIARKNLETLLTVEQLELTIQQNIQAIDEYFVQVLNEELEKARKTGDLERSARLQQVAEILQRASTPPELEFIEELVQLPDDTAIRDRIDKNSQNINQEFLDLVMNLLSQSENDKELNEKLQTIYRYGLRVSMQTNLNSAQ